MGLESLKKIRKDSEELSEKELERFSVKNVQKF